MEAVHGMGYAAFCHFVLMSPKTNGAGWVGVPCAAVKIPPLAPGGPLSGMALYRRDVRGDEVGLAACPCKSVGLVGIMGSNEFIQNSHCKEKVVR